VEQPRQTVLLVRAGARLCGLPVSSVGETLRPLPLSSIAGAPPFVLGVAVVRGEPTPVVDLGAFVGGSGGGPATRWVTVRAGAAHAALAVAEVLGVAALDPRDGRSVPLLGDGCAGAIASLRARDPDLLVVLDAARVVADAASAARAGPEVGA
jgi:purine-binding chemotaxis protein CheW